jgi:hypothetical protein
VRRHRADRFDPELDELWVRCLDRLHEQPLSDVVPVVGLALLRREDEVSRLPELGLIKPNGELIGNVRLTIGG